MKIFETQNADLATFLIYEGIKLLECKVSSFNSRVVIMVFEDNKQNCRDLERVYLSSDFKKFRDINKYLLSQINKCLKDSLNQSKHS